MSRKNLFATATAVVALVGAVSAFAQTAHPGPSEVSGEKSFEIATPFVSIASRDQVRMEAVAAARHANRSASGEKSGDVAGPFASTPTRAAVVAETREAIHVAGSKAVSMPMASR